MIDDTGIHIGTKIKVWTHLQCTYIVIVTTEKLCNL